MDINGIKGNFQAMKVKPGIKLEDVKEATKDNDLQEIVIKNKTGLHVVVAKKLEITPDYADNDGIIRETNLTSRGKFPVVGDKINFGDLKGEVVHIDTEGSSATVGKSVGAVGGTIGGFALGLGLLRLGIAGKGFASFYLGGSILATSTLGGLIGGLELGPKVAPKPKYDNSKLAKIATPE